jgi:hypothetical protein
MQLCILDQRTEAEKNWLPSKCGSRRGLELCIASSPASLPVVLFIGIGLSGFWHVFSRKIQ